MRLEFPNPQQKRERWQPLNGEWDFCFGEKLSDDLLKIEVPFAYQTERSGINDKTDHEFVCYKRKFELSDGVKDCKKITIRFLAVDNECWVFVNGNEVCSHKGGYAAFNADITPYLVEGENEIVVKVYDSKSSKQPRGKQTYQKTPFECWYYPTTGIWQSVWLEGNDGDYLENFYFTPSVDTGEVKISLQTAYGVADRAVVTVHTKKGEKQTEISLAEGKGECVDIYTKSGKADESELWSAENPTLFPTVVRLYEGNELLDEMETYLFYRKIETRGKEIYLNDKPLKLKMLLDQGYWRESSITPPSIDALRYDIEICKKMGFNGVRKHQKVEDPYFNYYADNLGFYVWAETPSGYLFCEEEKEALILLQKEVVRKNYNNPSVIVYVPFNESWGIGGVYELEEVQQFVKEIYYLTKSLDETRLCLTNDGWENLSCGDMVTIHDYSARGDDFDEKYTSLTGETIPQMNRRVMVKGDEVPDKPLMLTEYGGISLTNGNGWGYGKVEDGESAFMDRFEALLTRAKKFFCGICYTQISDCEQEVNGLLDADHKPKFSIEKIRAIVDKY